MDPYVIIVIIVELPRTFIRLNCVIFLLQRSYRSALFDDAINRMIKARIKTETELEQFRILQSKVDSLVVEKAQTDVDFSDAPDEFRGKKILNSS